METRANYVAVGAFVLTVLAGVFVAVLWLARVQFETGYKYYETHVAGPVTGLGSGALVRLNGIEIGRVTRIELDPKDPQLVRLILQVRNTVEIRTDAVASTETLGLTGVQLRRDLRGDTWLATTLGCGGTAVSDHNLPAIFASAGVQQCAGAPGKAPRNLGSDCGGSRRQGPRGYC